MTFGELRNQIETFFNISELRTLCFDLGIEYENLAGETREDKSRELVDYCRRHNRVSALIRRCQQLIPQVQWSVPNLFEQFEFGPTPTVHFPVIPNLPETYFAHVYSLQNYLFVGRDTEIQKINQWAVSRNERAILNIIALGGAGKSALAWHWFNEISPKILPTLAGRVWWSFYESQFQEDEFFSSTLAYVSQQPYRELAHLTLYDKQQQLLYYLRKKPFLIVLDGLERVMLGYSELGKSLLNDEPLDSQQDNNLSKLANSHLADFLKKLIHLKPQSLFVITSRHYPSDLRDRYTGDETTPSLNLSGLSDNDALRLWYEIGLNGKQQELHRLFHTFANHAVVLIALAGAIKKYRQSPGNFEQWVLDHPDFNPYRLTNIDACIAHILEYSFKDLDIEQGNILNFIAALYIPTSYDLLVSLVDDVSDLENHSRSLDMLLTDLEERGLLGWEKPTNSYEVHPVIRGFIWRRLDGSDKRLVYRKLFGQFRRLVPANLDIKRDYEIALATKWFNEEGSRVLTVVGPPASGKTLFLAQLKRELDTIPNVITFFVEVSSLLAKKELTSNETNEFSSQLLDAWLDTVIAHLRDICVKERQIEKFPSTELKIAIVAQYISQIYCCDYKICFFIDGADSLSSTNWKRFEKDVIEIFGQKGQNVKFVFAMSDSQRLYSYFLRRHEKLLLLGTFSSNQGHEQLTELMKYTSGIPLTVEQIQGLIPGYNWSHPGLNIILFVLLSDYISDKSQFVARAYLKEVLVSLGYLPEQQSEQVLDLLMVIADMGYEWTIEDISVQLNVRRHEAWSNVELMRQTSLITNVNNKYQIVDGIREFIYAVKNFEIDNIR